MIVTTTMAGTAADPGADAAIGVDTDDEALGEAGSVPMVTSAGTAAKLRG